ncbi:MAG: FMN-dependent oxidoreductase, nitrilotriacetate monooxygenase family [Frankiales bacterium]|nr:FMN-dependent oxidoreductase, nitrilotriacetate monooxygenase family [Frankiales bacterium]
MTRKLHFGLHPYGVGGPGSDGLWKDPRVAKNASVDIKYYIAQAKLAESGLFDAFFIVDSQFINASYPAHYLNRLEPLTLLSAVATHTTNIGLVVTASSTYNSPFNLARRVASLDHISDGRAGWNVVTSFDSQVSKNFGLDEHLDYATRYGRALEFVEVARGLWDSYEDDAFPADVERGVFLDPGKLHALNHVGEHFKVAGPLNLARSKQGQPVIFQSGVSEDGRNLAAQIAEGIFSPGESLESSREHYADVKRRAAALGRNPDDIVILPNGSPVVASTDEKAYARSREVYEEDNDFNRKLAFFGRTFGAYDFTQHDLDAPFPALSADLSERGGRRGADLVQQAAEKGWTLRQTVEATSQYKPGPFVGSPQTVADSIQTWFEAGALDGLNLAFRLTEDLENFIGTVVPILQQRGLFRTEYEADTLRGNLGIPFPINRHARVLDLVDV